MTLSSGNSRGFSCGRVLTIALILALLFSFVQFYHCEVICNASGAGAAGGGFLENVVGLNMSEVTRTGLNLVYMNHTYDLMMSGDGELFSYSLCQHDLVNDQASLDGDKTWSDCVSIASQAVAKYRQLYGGAHCDELVAMLSTAMQNQTSAAENNSVTLDFSRMRHWTLHDAAWVDALAALQNQRMIVETVENEDAILTISTSQLNRSSWLYYQSYTSIHWFKKILNQYTSGYQAISIDVAKNGLLTGFVDDVAYYYVATTNVNVSEAEAINMSLSYAEAYAQQHGQEILVYANGSYCAFPELCWDIDRMSRGDDPLAIYPYWNVVLRFDASKEWVDGYSVSIWADNGQVAQQGPYAFADVSGGGGNGANSYLWVAVGVVIVVPIAACSTVYLRRRSKNRRLKE